jgi:eukaryotic-like serine/threonine-protein kinase
MSSLPDSSPPPPRRPQTSRYYAPGEVVARKYELLRPLGEGGMGAVWLARNLLLDTEVAIKLIRAEFDADDAGDRLLQEARAAARLEHRAIVRVFDVGHTEQGDPFIVMEVLAGESLADVLASRGRVPPAKAVQTLLPVIDALGTAHQRGIVHRDLKPENIFLARETRRTQPKVVDFGIAKVEQRGPSRTLTRQGTVLGSPGYMSPEQARGLSTVDHRSDIWAICVVLYECVTGTPAFRGDNYNALMRAIIEEEVVPSHELSAGDHALWTLIERGLKKDPSARWESMRHLGVELARWLVDRGIDHDVCGDSLSSWLEETATPGKRDLLSMPPPSMVVGRARGNTPDGTRTEPGLAPVGVGSAPPVGPESTAAVVSSVSSVNRGPGFRGLPLAVGVAACVLTFMAVVIFRGTEPTPKASSGREAASASVEAPRPLPPAAEAASIAPTARPVLPAAEPRVSPTVTSTVPVLAPPARAKASRAAPAAAKSGKPAPRESGGSDLKDPYAQ